MPQVRTLPEAALYCDSTGCPYSWISKSGTGFKVDRYQSGTPAGPTLIMKAAKKRAEKSRAARRKASEAKKRATKKRTTKKRTTKKRTTKKRTTKKATGPWGASIAGETPRALFMRKQKRAGRSPAQARAAWTLSRAAKKRGKKTRTERAGKAA